MTDTDTHDPDAIVRLATAGRAGEKELNAMERVEKARRTGGDVLNFLGLDLDRLPPLGGLPNVKCLCLDGTAVADLSPVVELSSLEEASFRSMRAVSDWANLRSLKGLRILSLSGSSITKLDPIAELAELFLLDCSFTDLSDLTPLAQMRTLKRIALQATSVADLGPLSPMPGAGRGSNPHTQQR